MEWDARALTPWQRRGASGGSRYEPERARTHARIRLFETVAMATIVAVVAGLVLYPIYYLLQASLDVGLPDSRPPTAYGIANFAKLLDYPQIIWNTLVVTFVSTVMALLFGFVTRLDSHAHERAFQAHARSAYDRSILRDAAARRSCLELPRCARERLHQSVLALARRNRSADRHHLADGHRLGDGAVRGLGRLRHDQRGHAVDGPGARGGLAGHGRKPLADHVARDAAAGRARRAGRSDLRVRGDAGLVLRRARARHASALLRDHHRDLSFRLAVSATHSACRRHGRVAVRRDVRDALALPLADIAQQLRDRVSGKAFRPRVMDMGRLRWALFGIVALYVFLSAILPVATLFFASLQRLAVAFPAASNFTLDQFPPGVLHQCRAHGHAEQRDPRRRHGDARAS